LGQSDVDDSNSDSNSRIYAIKEETTACETTEKQALLLKQNQLKREQFQ
jgi:hypothetical protein